MFVLSLPSGDSLCTNESYRYYLVNRTLYPTTVKLKVFQANHKRSVVLSQWKVGRKAGHAISHPCAHTKSHDCHMVRNNINHDQRENNIHKNGIERQTENNLLSSEQCECFVYEQIERSENYASGWATQISGSRISNCDNGRFVKQNSCKNRICHQRNRAGNHSGKTTTKHWEYCFSYIYCFDWLSPKRIISRGPLWNIN